MRQFRRQVSWLSALRLRPPSRFPSGIEAVGSPITVAGAASDWGARPGTVFPFDPLAGHRPLLDRGPGEAASILFGPSAGVGDQVISPAAWIAATPPASMTRQPAMTNAVRCAGHLVTPSTIAQDATPSAVWATSRPAT